MKKVEILINCPKICLENVNYLFQEISLSNEGVKVNLTEKRSFLCHLFLLFIYFMFFNKIEKMNYLTKVYCLNFIVID